MTPAEKIDAATSEFELYKAVVSLTDQELADVARQIGPGIKRAVVVACVSNANPRLASWVQSSKGTSLDAMLREADAVVAQPGRNQRAVGQLVVDLANMISALPTQLLSTAARLAIRHLERSTLVPPEAGVTIARAAASYSTDATRAQDLQQLSVACAISFERTSDATRLDEAIALGRESLQFFGPSGDDRETALHRLSMLFGSRYTRSGARNDLDHAIRLGSEAVGFTGEGIRRQNPAYLQNLSNQFAARSRTTGSVDDIETAVQLVSTALSAVDESDPSCAGLFDSFASRLGEWHQKAGIESLLNAAIEAAFSAFRLTKEQDPNFPGRVSNLASHYGTRGASDESLDDLDLAIHFASQAVERTAREHPDYSRWLNNLAGHWQRRAKLSASLADVAAAVHFGREALLHGPRASVSRPGHLTNQVFRLRIAGRDSEVETLLAEWCDLVADGYGEFASVFGNANQLVNLLLEEGNNQLAAQVGLVALGRAISGSPTGRTFVRRAAALMDGVASATALALIRANQPLGAADVLETAAGIVARFEASEIDWGAADATAPDLVARIRRASARIGDSDGVEGSPEALDPLSLEVARLFEQLREEIGIPRRSVPRADDLSALPGSHTWLVATKHGGAFIHRSEMGWEAAELAELTVDQVESWRQQLVPELPITSSELPGRAIRGPRGSGVPSEGSVRGVCEELRAVVIDRLPHRVGDGDGDGGANGHVDWLIPFGVVRLLPWQGELPLLRMHLSAAYTARQPEVNVGDLPLIVFADPDQDLPGARAEALDLSALDAETLVGTDAAIGALIDISKAPAPHRLHFAAHGTADPGIKLSDGVLGVGNAHQIGQLFAHCAHLTINACTSAAHAAGHADDHLGLAAIAHAWGTAKTTVALWPLDDAQARVWANHRYGEGPSTTHIATTHAYQTYG